MKIKHFIQRQWKPFLWTNALFALYGFINLLWSDILLRFSGDWFYLFLIGFGLILFPFYIWINYKVELGNWVVLFFIPSILLPMLFPITPYSFYYWIFSTIWYDFVPIPKTDSEGWGYIIVETVNCLIVVVALYISKGKKMTKTK